MQMLCVAAVQLFVFLVMDGVSALWYCLYCANFNGCLPKEVVLAVWVLAEFFLWRDDVRVCKGEGTRVNKRGTRQKQRRVRVAGECAGKHKYSKVSITCINHLFFCEM